MEMSYIMFCSNCGKEISISAKYCWNCGIKIDEIKPNKTNSSITHDPLNPILNSPEDITDELIQRIINNSLESLTLNYQFTSTPIFENNSDDDSRWKKQQIITNPFTRANEITPLRRIEFEVVFTENVTSLSAMFYGFKKLEYVNIKSVSHITDMSWMFYNATVFNQNISNWDTSMVTDMSFLFYGAVAFNQPIGNWDTSKVTNMNSMFCYADSFNQPIGRWNTSEVTDMSFMFSSAVMFNQPIGKWNTSKVTNMSSMFNSAHSFNQPIGNWDTSNVTNMRIMFLGARSFNLNSL